MPGSGWVAFVCWGSRLLEAEAQTVINILAIRWGIEVFFEDAKDLLGSDHDQLMTAEALSRLWTWIACLSCFLEEQRAAHDHLAAWGDARRAIQQELTIVGRDTLSPYFSDRNSSGYNDEPVSFEETGSPVLTGSSSTAPGRGRL